MTTDSQRIETLESQLAFQEETIQQLSDALIAQQLRIDALQATLEHLVATRGDDGSTALVDEKPPHY